MSTRADVILKETYKDSFGTNHTEELMFYRHSDGYPEGVMPTLEKLSDWIKRKKVRNNLSQVAGWLVLLGAMEYNTIPYFEVEDGYLRDMDTIKDPKDWKVGAYEPCTMLSGDGEYIYTVDVVTGGITYEEV